MKTGKKDIERDVRETMQLLEQLDRAAPREGFYHRVAARLSDETEQALPGQGWFVLWPRFGYMAVGFLLILMLNLLSLTLYIQSQSVDANQPAYFVEEQLESMPSLYSYENSLEE